MVHPLILANRGLMTALRRWHGHRCPDGKTCHDGKRLLRQMLLAQAAVQYWLSRTWRRMPDCTFCERTQAVEMAFCAVCDAMWPCCAGCRPGLGERLNREHRCGSP